MASRVTEPAPPQALASWPAERPAQRSPRAAYVLSAVAAALAALAAAVGLLVPGLYRDPAILVPQVRGQDLVTLVVGVPVLLIALAAAARGSTRGHLVWLGALGYLAYTYASYAFGARFNALFLVYVALLGLTVYALILGLMATDIHAVAARFSAAAPNAPVGVFLLVAAGLTTALWLMDIGPALLTGGVPRSALEAETPTSVIHVLDLALVLPACALAGVLLLRRAPWGYVLAGVLLAKIATLGLAILAMGLLLYWDGQPVAPGMVAFFGGLTVFSIGLCVAWLRSLVDADGAASKGRSSDAWADA